MRTDASTSETLGEFIFDFSVPFVPVQDIRTIEVGETVEVMGIPVTLEHATVTVAVAEAMLQIDSPSHLTPGITTLIPPGWDMTNPPPTTAPVQTLEPGSFAARFNNNDDLLGYPGVWMLKIQWLDDRDTGRRINGPWEFEVEVE